LLERKDRQNWVWDWAVIPTQGRFAGDGANDSLGDGLEVVGIGIAAVQGLFLIFDLTGIMAILLFPLHYPLSLSLSLTLHHVYVYD
jgi:hypothetical protein